MLNSLVLVVFYRLIVFAQTTLLSTNIVLLFPFQTRCFLMIFTRTFNIVLNRSDKSRDSCLVLYLKRKAFSLSTLSTLVIGFW